MGRQFSREFAQKPMSEYRSPRVRANWTLVLLSVFGIFIYVSMFSTIAEIVLLNRIENGSFVSEAEITSNDDRQQPLVVYTS